MQNIKHNGVKATISEVLFAESLIVRYKNGELVRSCAILTPMSLPFTVELSNISLLTNQSPLAYVSTPWGFLLLQFSSSPLTQKN
jgi:hypothetical protein